MMLSERRPAFRALQGWTIFVSQDAHAIRECSEQSWMSDRVDPHA
ncbi:hypothetical protein ACVWY5_001490 [Bradyrhizobium sp. USDA 3256]